MSPFLKITNARIVMPKGIITNGTLIAENGRIKAIEYGPVDFACDNEIDAEGNILSPGFIDIHVHGGGGYDFMDNTVDAYLKIAEMHARFGTTAMAPTSLSTGLPDLVNTLACYEKAITQNHNGADFIGFHIEGPYVSMEQKGAQNPLYIRDPNPTEYTSIIERFPFVKRWSAAPELPGAMEFGRYLKANHVLPAIAHTDAVFEDVIEAFNNGFTHVTHFYSCMSTVFRKDAMRYAGSVEATYFLDDMTVEIIADGVHLPPALLKLVCKLKGYDNISLITDAMRAAGLPPGESYLGTIEDNFKVIVEDDVAKLPDRSAFAGSVATCDKLVKNMVQLADVPFVEAIKMMTINAAKIMGVDGQKGSLEVGKDADLVLMTDDFKVLQTVVRGKTVYKAEKEN
ncbi:N-acetylglucosamine-6-phosphate deacetylase [Mucilaginibacter sp. CAU 1740]|uniref:N-acetylglucosamine-6-phosphate deacetylase n=1 Tax=Mucilaginibacter sp. CAU 1740 TaxID=3140365 RepID=UPI00325B8D4E